MPRATPWAFELLKIGLFKSLPSGQVSRSNTPPISTELPLLKDKFGLQSSTLHAFQREIRCNDTFNLFLKTLFKKLFTNKGERLSCKSIRTRKNQKKPRAYYIRTRDEPSSNSPPFQRNVQIPLSPGTMHSQMPGVCPGGGGMLKFRIDRRITGIRFAEFLLWTADYDLSNIMSHRNVNICLPMLVHWGLTTS